MTHSSTHLQPRSTYIFSAHPCLGLSKKQDRLGFGPILKNLQSGWGNMAQNSSSWKPSFRVLQEESWDGGLRTCAPCPCWLLKGAFVSHALWDSLSLSGWGQWAGMKDGDRRVIWEWLSGALRPVRPGNEGVRAPLQVCLQDQVRHGSAACHVPQRQWLYFFVLRPHISSQGKYLAWMGIW